MPVTQSPPVKVLARVQCPDCGFWTDDHGQHVCMFPVLTEAAGVPLTADELRIIRWLSGWDREMCEVLAGLMRRIRQ